MAFNESNYRRLRAYLLTREGKFNWRNAYEKETDSGCIACACVRIERGIPENQLAQSNHHHIWQFIGCTNMEAMELFVGYRHGENEHDVHAAIKSLDEVAARYGVTPEPPSEEPVSTFVPDEAAYLAELRAFVAAPALSPEEAR